MWSVVRTSLIAALMLAAGCVVVKQVPAPAAPAGPVAQPTTPAPFAPAAPSLENTIWRARSSSGELYVYYFRPGGKLEWDSPTGMANSNGTWKQEGVRITMHMNDGGTMLWDGVLEGDRMSGEARDQKGRRFTWQATKEREATVDAPSVEGTVWRGYDSDGDLYTYYFNRGGQLSWDSPSGTGHTTGTWRQQGNRIYMETNGRYAEWAGTISGEEMNGKAWNQAGHRWTWTARRIR